MIRAVLILAASLFVLTACDDPLTEPDFTGAVRVTPNGVEPNVGVSIGNVRFGRGGIVIGVPL